MDFFWVLSTGFMLWMIYDCIQQGRTQPWLFILIFLPGLGALLYFFTFKLSDFNVKTPAFANGKLRKRLMEAKANVQAIGNAHQYVVLGDIHVDMGNFQEAAPAFNQALEMEPKNTGALWGAAQVAVKTQKWDRARDVLEALLEIDPEYLRGDASLAYAHILMELEDWETAKEFLPADIRKWGHPSVSVLLAELYIKEGDGDRAKELLEGMVTRVKGGYDFYYKQHKGSVRKAERLLRSL